MRRKLSGGRRGTERKRPVKAGKRGLRAVRAKAAPAKDSAPGKAPEARAPEKAPTPAPLLVVAVGASAGGLEAFVELVRHLPADAGAAIVLMQHLSAERESLLAEILQKSSKIPVRLIEEGLELARNVIHVAPALFDVGVENDVFTTSAKPARHGRNMPIDRLFEAIAEQYGTRAVGVVLSGTLSDGALGLRAIKAAGGMTFAQDAETAAFAEMPRAAVAGGGVDRVLSPERIAREIVRISKHPYMREPDRPAAESADALEGDETDTAAWRKLFHILRTETGVDFVNYRRPTFRRRVLRRMALRRIGTLVKYVEFLRVNPQEVDALYEDVLITVTRFFRDPEVFDILKKSVVPALIERRLEGAPLRVWVTGCSTGEEVYSIAIALFEALQAAASPYSVQIFATDISETALQKARAGEYLENALIDVSEERLRKFFVQTAAGWQISKLIRDVCVFARQNVAADPPFSGLDLLSCRNLLIYLDPTLQQRVFPYFHYALKPGGFLMLGRSESVGVFSDLFEPYDRAHRIFVRRSTSGRPFGEGGRPPFSDRAAQRGLRGTPLPPPPSPLPERADRLLLERYAPPAVLLDGSFEVLQLRGRTAPFLDAGVGSGSASVLKLVRPSLAADLRATLMRAQKTGRRVRRDGLRLAEDGAIRLLSLEVTPIRDEESKSTSYLVLFDGGSRSGEVDEVSKKSAGRRKKGTSTALERELQATKRYLQSIIEDQETTNEELKSSSEEILSANEELQSTNEELETAKEELQSANEELSTVNEELQVRNNELAYAHNDLANLFGISLPIVMIGANGIIRRFTEPAARIFNLEPTDVGRSLSGIHPRLRNVNVWGLVARVLEAVQPLDAEVQDDAGNWYSLRIKPYRTMDNKIDGAIVALFDLRTTEQITRSLDYADALVETVQESLIVLDEDLRVRYANRAFYRLFRTTGSEITGEHLASLRGLETGAGRLLELLSAVAADREPLLDREIEIDVEGLGRKTFVVNARRVEPGGQLRPVVVVSLEDVTERRWAELGRRSSELRYRLLFETAREGIWLIDGDSRRILDVNPYLAELLGFRREELVGKVPWQEDLYRDSEAAERRFEDLLARGFTFDPEVSMCTRDGDEIQIEAVSNVYSVGNSRVVQCNMRDLSERNRLQGQLRRAQKVEAIGALAGGVAHDFNNLLNIISAHLELAVRLDEESDKRRQSVDAIRKTLQRGTSVVRQLLTFARREKAAFEDVSLNALVEEIVGIVRETFPRSIAIETSLAPGLPRVRADPNQIHQAILNLLVNARDAMPSGGRVRIETRTASSEKVREAVVETVGGDYVELTVADEGVGMDEEAMKRVFEPFFTTKSDSGGQGLGLAVVHTILDSHGAMVDVASRRGEGTRFRIWFPVPAQTAGTDAGEEASRPPELPREPASGGNGEGGQTILLVEDEDLLRDAVVSLLEAEGYRVLTARDGLEAVDRHAAHRDEISAVILDLGLPKLGGWEAFLRMKALDPALKAIVASGNLDRERRTEMRDQGLLASLRKPYAPEEILKTVRRVLARA
jgi:two-component system CheB/CheR fusion protein